MWLAIVGSLWGLFGFFSILFRFWNPSPVELEYTRSTGQYLMTESIVASGMLSNWIGIFAIWISLYIGSSIKDKQKNRGQNTLTYKFVTLLATVLCFVIMYLILPLPLIDNRTIEGNVSYINLESIGYFVNGIYLFIYIAVASLFL